MSSEPTEVDPATDPPGDQRSTWSVTKEFLARTWWLLLAALLALVALLTLAYFGAPWREVGIAVLILCFVGPFLLSYIFLWVYYIDTETRRFALLADQEHRKIGLLDMARDYFAELEVEGGSLADRDSQAGKVYIAEKFEVRQTTEVDPETGVEKTVPQPTLVATWEGDLDPLEFIEERERLQEVKEKLVPLAVEAVKARAGADMKALDNSIKQMHAVIAGAENDEFVDLGADPFDYDTGVDLDDLEDVLDRDDGHQAEFSDVGESGMLPLKDRELDLDVDLENGTGGFVSDD